MRNKLITSALITAFLFTTISLFAQDKAAAAKQNEKTVTGMQLKQGMMPGRLNMLRGLNLTDEQKEKIQKINLDHQKEMIKIESEIQLKRVEMKEIFAEKQVNTAKLEALTETIGKLELQVKKMKTENWVKINSLLKDDQKEIWKKHFAREGFMRQRAQMGKGMMQGRMGQRKHAMMQRQMGQRGHGMMQKGMDNGTMLGRDQAMGAMQGRGQGMMKGKMGQVDQNKKEEVQLKRNKF